MKKRTVSFRLPVDVVNLIDRTAKEKGINKTDVICAACSQYFGVQIVEKDTPLDCLQKELLQLKDRVETLEKLALESRINDLSPAVASVE